MVSSKFTALLSLTLACMSGQTSFSHAATVDHYSQQELIARAREKGGVSPLFTEIRAKYPNHYTMLVSRHADGQSEFHVKYADVLVILKGEGEIVTGGSMVGMKQTAEGEQRGSGISGGSSSPLRRGDIVHIPAGTPHQVKLRVGGNITYFVIKVDETAGSH
jgi:mannose-6-phosphate isomerase-like protein (cupin superfamily)